MNFFIPFVLSLVLKNSLAQLCEEYFVYKNNTGQITELNEYLFYSDGGAMNLTCYQDALDFDAYFDFCQSNGWQPAWIESIQELDFIYSKLSTGIYRLGIMKNTSEDWETLIASNFKLNSHDVIFCGNNDHSTLGLFKSENQSCFESLESNDTAQFICKRSMF